MSARGVRQLTGRRRVEFDPQRQFRREFDRSVGVDPPTSSPPPHRQALHRNGSRCPRSASGFPWWRAWSRRALPARTGRIGRRPKPNGAIVEWTRSPRARSKPSRRSNAAPRWSAGNSRGGPNAAENFIAAVRCLYRHLENDGRLDQHHNPARRVTKPRRNASTRRALANTQLAELNDVVASTGDDPELESLICRLHEESACRRGCALALRPRDLDRQQCAILLREKGETARWQPVSPTLIRHLIAHHDERGNGDPNNNCCATRAATRSPAAAMTTSSAVSGPNSRGRGHRRSASTGSATPH